MGDTPALHECRYRPGWMNETPPPPWIIFFFLVKSSKIIFEENVGVKVPINFRPRPSPLPPWMDAPTALDHCRYRPGWVTLDHCRYRPGWVTLPSWVYDATALDGWHYRPG